MDGYLSEITRTLWRLSVGQKSRNISPMSSMNVSRRGSFSISEWGFPGAVDGWTIPRPSLIPWPRLKVNIAGSREGNDAA